MYPSPHISLAFASKLQKKRPKKCQNIFLGAAKWSDQVRSKECLISHKNVGV